MNEFYFKDVTLLITHYNRSKSLERLIKLFAELQINFEDIIVCDDSSEQEHLEYIKELQQNFNFRLLTGPKNLGLANNINKGQKAVVTDFVLYVQEDFIPTANFSFHFNNGYQLLKEFADIDIVRFYAYFKYPKLKPVRDGYSEMIFKFWSPGYRKFYCYSDHPHLRRSNFPDKFGPYKEFSNSDKTEYHMMFSFLQKKGKGLFFVDFKELFIQNNSITEPSTVKRTNLRESNNIVITLIRHFYRHLKFNFDYLFRKF